MAGITWNVKDNTEYFLKRVSDNAMEAMRSAGDEMVKDIRYKMLAGYDEPHPKPYPHTSIQITRRLHDSIRAEVERSSADIVELTVGTDVEYAQYVHEGTYKLHGRPFIKDGVQMAQGYVEYILADHLDDGL